MFLHSLIIPVFNNAPVVMRLHARISQIAGEWIEPCGDQCEIILVNNGSSDASASELDRLYKMDHRYQIIHLARKSGHQTPYLAGLERAFGDTVTTLDADFQDPPEVIPRFIQKWKEGYDVVFGIRQLREDETWFKLWTTRLFNRMRREISEKEIPLGTGNFRLMDRKVVNEWIRTSSRQSPPGFRQTGIHYERM